MPGGFGQKAGRFCALRTTRKKNMTNGFKELGLSEAALKAVDALKYTDPTPVQE